VTIVNSGPLRESLLRERSRRCATSTYQATRPLQVPSQLSSLSLCLSLSLSLSLYLFSPVPRPRPPFTPPPPPRHLATQPFHPSWANLLFGNFYIYFTVFVFCSFLFSCPGVLYCCLGLLGSRGNFGYSMSRTRNSPTFTALYRPFSSSTWFFVRTLAPPRVIQCAVISGKKKKKKKKRKKKGKKKKKKEKKGMPLYDFEKSCRKTHKRSYRAWRNIIFPGIVESIWAKS
jgi:hypothetical protein